MDSSATSGGVRHNRAHFRFEVEVDGHLAHCDYELRGSEFVLTHTFVPPELRGRGLAELVVRAALEYARGEKLRVTPVCSYVAKFVAQHPELGARAD